MSNICYNYCLFQQESIFMKQLLDKRTDEALDEETISLNDVNNSTIAVIHAKYLAKGSWSSAFGKKAGPNLGTKLSKIAKKFGFTSLNNSITFKSIPLAEQERLIQVAKDKHVKAGARTTKLPIKIFISYKKRVEKIKRF